MRQCCVLLHDAGIDLSCVPASAAECLTNQIMLLHEYSGLCNAETTFSYCKLGFIEP